MEHKYNKGSEWRKWDLHIHSNASDGKNAIEWIMKRYAITTHKDSVITHNPNLWAAKHNDKKYILNLLLSIITVSLETIKIVNSLPTLKFDADE